MPKPGKVWTNGEQVFAADLNGNFDELWAQARFGGDGSTGSGHFTSNTTINLGGEKLVVLQYEQLIVDSGITVNFSNPHASGSIIYIKSRLDADIQGTIDAGGMGGDAATDGTGNIVDSDAGGNGVAGTGSRPGGTAGAGVRVGALNVGGMYYVVPGSGGGTGGDGLTSGGAFHTAGGVGGRGGGALIIECAGELTFTGNLYSYGQDGGDGAGGTISSGGGGGGGSGGMVITIANSYGTFSGTIYVGGGAKGDQGVFAPGPGGGYGGSGGGGGGFESAGTAGNSAAGEAGADGGAGAAGKSLQFTNHFYA